MCKVKYFICDRSHRKRSQIKYLTLHISIILYEHFTIKQIEQSILIKLINYITYSKVNK